MPYDRLHLNQLKSKNNTIKSRYIHLHQSNIGRARKLVTFTMPSKEKKQEQLLLVNEIKNYFAKRLQNLKSDVQYFSVIEFGEQLNNPHLHFQLFYNDEDNERIERAFTKTIQQFHLNPRRSRQTEDNDSLSQTSSHNYVIKEFDNTQLTDEEILTLDKVRRSFKKGKAKHMQLHSQSRPKHPYSFYRKMWITYQMNYFNVNELLQNNYANRLMKEEFEVYKRNYELPFIHFSTGMIKVNIMKLYHLALLPYLFLIFKPVSSEKSIYSNKYRNTLNVIIHYNLNRLYLQKHFHRSKLMKYF